MSNMTDNMELRGVNDTENANDAALERSDEFVDCRTNVSTREDVPPDGGYGWVCIACVFLINAHSWGVNSVRTIDPRKRSSHGG